MKWIRLIIQYTKTGDNTKKIMGGSGIEQCWKKARLKTYKNNR